MSNAFQAIGGMVSDAWNKFASDPAPKSPQGPETIDETEILSEVNRLYRTAKDRRKDLELEWARNLSYLEGRHWLRIDRGAGRLRGTEPLDDVLYPHTINHIRRVCLTVVNLSTQNKPDAQALPESDLEIDGLAADEADAVLSYTESRFAAQRLRTRATYWSLATGGGWRTVWWDESDTAELQTPEGVIQADIGNICAEIVPTFELFIDPQADCWERARWVIRETVRSVAWCRERWGKKAEGINADARSMDTLSSYAAPFFLDYRPDEQLKNGVRVLELWEKPSPKFRQGRRVVVAGNRVLEYDKNPYHDKPGSKCLPFVPTYYQDAIGHPYGLPLISDLVDPQDEYNRLWSKLLSRFEKAAAYIAVPTVGGASPKGIHDTREMKVIAYDPLEGGVGQPPSQIIGPPDLSGGLDGMLAVLKAEIESLAGIVNLVGQNGQAPDLSGLAIDLLQQQGNTQHDQLRANIEQAEAEMGDWIVFLFGKMAGQAPRLLGMDSEGNPDESAGGVRTLTALQQGGSCRVRVTPGSATARTPAAQRAFTIELFNLGVFGPFQDPEQIKTAIRLIEALDYAGSTKLLRKLESELEELEAQMQAEQAQMLAQQQQEQEMQMLMAQMQQAQQPGLEEQLAMKQAEADIQAGAEEHRADLDMQKEIGKAALQGMMPPPSGKPQGGSK